MIKNKEKTKVDKEYGCDLQIINMDKSILSTHFHLSNQSTDLPQDLPEGFFDQKPELHIF